MKVFQHPLLPRQHLLPSNDSQIALRLFAQKSKALIEVLSKRQQLLALSDYRLGLYIHCQNRGSDDHDKRFLLSLMHCTTRNVNVSTGALSPNWPRQRRRGLESAALESCQRSEGIQFHR